MSACRECGCKDGDRGPRGPQGEKGDTGASGAIGATGPAGPQGPQGIQGNQGDQGLQGPAGNDGSNIAGPVGPTGPQGNQGIQGPAGNDGADGADGANGLNGQGRLNYVEETGSGAHTITPVVNTGLILKNTGFGTIELPASTTIGDEIAILGTSLGTGGWKLVADGTDQIQMTNQSASALITSPGGEVVIAATNYRDVIHLIADGLGNWIIKDAIFANNNLPLFM